MDTITKPGFGADLAHGGGTVLDAVSYLTDKTGSAYKKAAKYGKASTKFENAQLDAKGKEAFASAQRGALAEQKTADLAISRAVAVAAGSGGSATDPTVMDIIGNLASEGKTNALSALYEGQSTQAAYQNEILANNHNSKTNTAGYNFKGKAYDRANLDSAFGTLLSGGSTFLQKYG
jgi:murein L,D-transpeptidase YcbB/YkuD